MTAKIIAKNLVWLGELWGNTMTLKEDKAGACPICVRYKMKQEV